MTILNQITAAEEAAEHAIRPQSRFGWLAIGARFRFPGSARVQVKTSQRGYKTDGTGKTWNTGQMTAVIPVR